MQALWYLIGRQLVNSARRTLRHPLRLAVTLLVIGWFGLVMGANLFFAVSLRMREAPSLPGDSQLISRDNLLALIMAAHFGVLWYPLTPWIGFSSLPLFTPADIHFLFPSPQRRLVVFFFLLLARGFANSLFLLMALVFLVLAFGHELIASALVGSFSMPLMYGWVYPLMYLLAFLGLLGCSILIALKEEQCEGSRALLALVFWSVVGVLVGMLGMYAYQAWRSGYDPLQEVVWHVLHNPMVAVPLTPLRALAEAALAVYHGWTPYVTLGFALWGGFAGTMFWLLARQQDWLYELATRISSWTTAYTLRRQSPAHAAYVDAVSYLTSLEKASPRWSLFERWTPQGVWALFWCHSLILWRMARGMMWAWSVMLVFGMTMLFILWFYQGMEPEAYSVLGIFLLYFGAFFGQFFSQATLVGAIRRMEMNRSLPFAARQVVWMEILPPSLLLWGTLAVPWAAFCLLAPQHWQTLTAHFLQAGSLILVWGAGLFLVYLLAPDQTDYTQRVLLGILMLPMVFLTTLPTLVLWGLGVWLSLPALATAMVVVTGNLLATWAVVCLVAERYGRVQLTE